MGLFWSLTLLVFVMYTFAILFTQAAAEHLNGLSEGERGSDVNLEVENAYGGLIRSFYSLYQSISNGKSWGLCMDPLMEIDGFFGALFIIFISVSIFGVMNVLTAVFVESAMTSAQYYKDLIIQDSLRAKEIAVRHMMKVFEQIDVDGSGEITSDEMEEFLQDPQLHVYLESLEISAEDTRMLFRLLDRGDTGTINASEFCNGCLRLKGDAKSFDVHVVMNQQDRLDLKLMALQDVVQETAKDLQD